MTDRDYVLTRRKDPASLAAYISVMRGIASYGEAGDPVSSLDVAANSMRIWRARLWALRRANWLQLLTEKYDHARNCVPCGFDLAKGTAPRACMLRACPFCHGRKVSRVFMQLRNQMVEAGKLTMVQFYGHYGLTRDSTSGDMYCFSNGKMHDDRMDEVLRVVNVRRRRIRRKFAMEGVGAYQVDLSPRKRYDQWQLGGWWITRHRMLVSVPNKAKPLPKLKIGKVRYMVATDDYSLARLVGKTFPYNADWLRADAELTADLLNYLHSRRLFSTIGAS